VTADDRTAGAHTDIAELYIFEFTAGRISRAWGPEDTWSRLRQLGLTSETSTS